MQFCLVAGQQERVTRGIAAEVVITSYSIHYTKLYENVFPREIEAVLDTHPAVQESAVIGIPDQRRGQVPVAFVQLEDGAEATETGLRSFCRGKLAGYKVPRAVRFVERNNFV